MHFITLYLVKRSKVSAKKVSETMAVLSRNIYLGAMRNESGTCDINGIFCGSAVYFKFILMHR